MTWKGRGQCVLREELPAAFSYGLFLTLRGNPEAPGLSSFNLWASLPLELCFAQEVYYPRKRCYETSGLWEVAIPGDQGQCLCRGGMWKSLSNPALKSWQSCQELGAPPVLADLNLSEVSRPGFLTNVGRDKVGTDWGSPNWGDSQRKRG